MEHLTVVRDLEVRLNNDRYYIRLFRMLPHARTVVISESLLDANCNPKVNFGPDLTALWGAQLTFPLDVNCNGKLTAVSWKTPEYWRASRAVEESERYLDSLNVSQLESIWEPHPVFMRKRVVAPRLKLANIFFYREV